MIRKLLLPVACATLLGGCVTGYGYNDGGYYYGRPSSSVRYYGGASYGYPYGYGYDYGYGRYGYGYPYGGYYGGGYPYYRHHYCGDGHDHNCDHDDDDHHGGGDHDGDNDRPPWRRWADDRGDINKRRVEVEPQPAVRMATPGQRSRAMAERPPASVPRVAAPPRPVERVERRAAPRMSAPERPRNRQERDLRREQER